MLKLTLNQVMERSMEYGVILLKNKLLARQKMDVFLLNLFWDLLFKKKLGNLIFLIRQKLIFKILKLMEKQISKLVSKKEFKKRKKKF